MKLYFKINKSLEEIKFLMPIKNINISYLKNFDPIKFVKLLFLLD